MQIIIYSASSGKEPYNKWLQSLKDPKTILRIQDRISRIYEFNQFGDYKYLANGLYEIRFDFGADYRVYFAFLEENLIILLNGGDKSTQNQDIIKAQKYLEELQND